MLINRFLKINTPIAARLSEAVVVLANNVAEYFYCINSQEYWELENDFPNIAPPWPKIWFEYDIPKFVNSIELGIRENLWKKDCRRIGTLFVTQNIQNNIPKSSMEWILKSQMGFYYVNEYKKRGIELTQPIYDTIKILVNDQFKAMPDDVKKTAYNMLNTRAKDSISDIIAIANWSFAAEVFIERTNNTLEKLPFTISGLIDKKGHFSSFANGEGVTIIPDTFLNPDYSKMVCDTAALFLHVPFMTLSFIHCKNMKLIENNLPQKLSDKYKNRKKRKAAYKYYVLDINPIKEILKREGQSETTGLKKALHICRGHFATYTESAPLFGKHVGTFWKPMHTKGNAIHGVIEKDYSVKMPDQLP